MSEFMYTINLAHGFEKGRFMSWWCSILNADS